MKKLSLALLSGLALNVNAAVYQAPRCDAMNITAACLTGWEMGGDILYVQAQATEISAAPIQPKFRGDYGFGFRLEQSYHWGHGHDINVNWQYQSKESVRNLGLDVDPAPFVGRFAITSKFNIANFQVGHQLQLADEWHIRAHGGLQYANLKTSINSSNQVISAQDSVRREGWGPRAGLNLTHDFAHNYHMFADVAVGILCASFITDSSVDSPLPFQNIGLYFASLESDARLGASYTQELAQGKLTLRAGWQSNFYSAPASTVSLSWGGAFAGVSWQAA